MVEKNYARLGQRLWEGELPNGLKLLVDKRPGYGKQFAFFATRYGGVDMTFETAAGRQTSPAGVAHFLEHKLFDTREGNALQIMARNGCDPNAFTSFGMTGYLFQSTRGFEENLRTLLSFVTEPWFTPESVAKEQGIIGQEIAMGDDEAETEVFYDLLGCLYAHHPVRTHIAGTAESISHITADTLYACHRAFYTPSNMALAVVGDVDPEQVRALAAEIVTAPAGESPRRDYGAPEPPEAVKSETSRSMEVSAPLFQLGFKLPPPPHGPETLRRRLVGELAGELLLGESSPLYTQLYDQGLIDRSFGGGYENYPGCAFFTAGGESREPRRVRDAVLAEARRLGEEGIETPRFRRAVRAAYGGWVSGLNSFENTAVELVQSYFDGADYLTFPQVFETIAPEDVQALLARWFTPAHAALAVLTPEGEKL